MKASGPSFASSVRTTRSRNASAMISASCSGRSRPLRIARRVPRTASGALRLTSSAISRARSSSRSCSTTSETMPSSYARCALSRSWRPVSAIRIAMFMGSTRASRTISRPDTRPMLTCGSKNSARSDAMMMSPVVTRSSPAPQHSPFTAVSTGLVIDAERRCAFLRRFPLRVGREVRLVVDDASVVGDLGHVGSGAERPTRRR